DRKVRERPRQLVEARRTRRHLRVVLGQAGEPDRSVGIEVECDLVLAGHEALDLELSAQTTLDEYLEPGSSLLELDRDSGRFLETIGVDLEEDGRPDRSRLRADPKLGAADRA